MSEVRLEQVEAEAGRYRLVGPLTFASVPGLLETQIDMFTGAKNIELDLSQVERGDSAGLALLVSWLRAARQQGASLSLVGVSEQFHAMAQVSGLTEVLSLADGV